MNRKLVIGVVATAVIGALMLRQCGKRQPAQPRSVEVAETPPATATTTTAGLKAPSATALPSLPPIVSKSKPTPISKPAPVAKEGPGAVSTPPPVKIFPELIPKDIRIVRVYYASMITGPASTIEFDINGSGFNKEFEKMITVESGQPNASVKNLALITPNQIHGTLDINDKSATMLAFPKVLIQGKVVFQAPEPFAVIRPGEVLNLVFTEMGESGRSGRFRVFTNLNQEMFKDFKVTVSTPSIRVTDVSPAFPFLVDGTIIIGPAVGGDYDIAITLKDKTLWERKGVIRVVKPNVGQSGLIQKVMTLDGYQRPGDKVRFAIQGSGFQPDDVHILQAKVPDVPNVVSSFTYVSPGRLELVLDIPKDIPVKSYALTISAGPEILQSLPDAFRVVGANWPRDLRLNPALEPGEKSVLSLTGRDFDKDFVSKLKVEFDEPGLTLGQFSVVSPLEASAAISASADVKPGDYLLRITSDGKAVSPEFGSLIRVSPPKK